MEGLVSLVSRAAADRIGESRDRAGIGARQAGDDRIDKRAHAFRFRREADQRFANRSVGALGRVRRQHRGQLRSTAAPRPIAARTISSSLRGSSRKRRQRERIVGRT